MEYTVGILVDARREFICLLEKERPAWQAGRLNGPGGGLNPGETPAQCVAREALEEVDARTEPEQWRHFATLTCRNGDLVHFLYISKNMNIRTMTDEKAAWYNLAGIAGGDLPVIDNMRWLVPMAMDPTHGFAALAWDGTPYGGQTQSKALPCPTHGVLVPPGGTCVFCLGPMEKPPRE